MRADPEIPVGLKLPGAMSMKPVNVDGLRPVEQTHADGVPSLVA
jgi:hypothetical protein